MGERPVAAPPLASRGLESLATAGRKIREVWGKSGVKEDPWPNPISQGFWIWRDRGSEALWGSSELRPYLLGREWVALKGKL